MNKIRCWFSITFLVLLCWGNMAAADTDLLRLDSRQAGDTLSELGENLVVEEGTAGTTGRYVTGHHGIGKLKFNLANLPSNFTLSIKAYRGAQDSGSKSVYLIGGESSVKFDYQPAWVGLGDYSKYLPAGLKGDNWYSVNVFKLVVTGNQAALYINDILFSKATIPSVTYTTLTINGLRGQESQLFESRDGILEAKIIGASSSIIGQATFTTGTDVLGIASHSEGDKLTNLGENLILKTALNGQKYVTAYNTGTGDGIGSLRLNLPNLSGNFDIFVKTYLGRSVGSQKNIALIGGDSSITFGYSNNGWVYLGDHNLDNENHPIGYETSRWDYVNVFRLSVTGNQASLYINDVFFKKMTVPNATYTMLTLGDLNEKRPLFESEDGIFEVKVNAGTTPPVTQATLKTKSDALFSAVEKRFPALFPNATATAGSDATMYWRHYSNGAYLVTYRNYVLLRWTNATWYSLGVLDEANAKFCNSQCW